MEIFENINARPLLSELDKKKIKITAGNDALDIDTTEDILIPALKQQAVAFKGDIVNILTGSQRCKKNPLFVNNIDNARLLPLSIAQEYLWNLYNSRYREVGGLSLGWAVKLTGKLNTAVLIQAFNAIVQRHESLRTTFKFVGGQVVQVIAGELTLDIPVTRICAQKVPQYLALHAAHIFELSQGPLVKACLLTLSSCECLLLINIHRLVSDSYSIGLFNRELVAFYRAYTKNACIKSAYTKAEGCFLAPLPILPTQYAGFASWQRQYLQGDIFAREVNYWKAQLQGAPTLLELLTDRPRPAVQRYCGRSHSFSLPAELVQGLKQVSQSVNTTLFVTLLAGFNVLLARYSGQNDICVGTSVANRQREEFAYLIGLLSNKLVLRSNLEGNPTFEELLQQVKETTLSAYQHQSIPFEYLITLLEVEQQPSYTPLFQVEFILQNSEQGIFELPGLTLSCIEKGGCSTGFDLSVKMVAFVEGVEGAIAYNTDLFDQTTIERMVGHYLILLQGIATNPKQNLSDLPLLSRSERQKILFDWNNTSIDYPNNLCIHQLFERQVANTQDAIAFIFKERCLSYRQLNKRANQLAHYLLKQGVGPEVKVGLCVGRSLEMAVGILGILKAGGAYIPLDPSYPKDRLAYMLDCAEAEILLTLSGLKGRLPEQSNKVVYLDNHLDNHAKWSGDKAAAQNPSSQINGTNLAYVIFTSGSTGRPKALALSQRALVNLIQWQGQRSNFGVGWRNLQFTPLSFDVSFQDIFATWCSGGTLVLITEVLHQDPFALWRFIGEQRINRIFMPFIALQQLAQASRGDQWDIGLPTREKPGALTEIITAGESLHITPAIRQLFCQLPQCQLFNQYGPSETHVVTEFALGGSPEFWEDFPSIGKPIANNRVYILDPYGQPVPIGVVGELYIGGLGLARGYFGRDDLTAECFIQSPCRHIPEKRLYKTGDLARFRQDGNIEFKGRIDDQVKVRGFRIELGEIEQVLVEQPTVREAAVAVHRHNHNHNKDAQDNYLVAYMVTDMDGEGVKQQNPALLREALQALLPDYMLPSAFVYLAALPLTPSGKIDRRHLPPPDINQGQTQTYRAPCTDTERQLIAIWADNFNIPAPQISIDAEFLALGGHSLLATRLLNQIRQIKPVALQLADIFTAGTVRSLGRVIDGAQFDSAQPVPSIPIETTQALPLSYAQQRLWFINQFEQGADTRYNEVLALRLQGPLNVVALEAAIQTIIQRHDILRTSFTDKGNSNNGEAVQVVADKCELLIPLITLESSGPMIIEKKAIEKNIALFSNHYAAHLFDLSTGPLINVVILRLAADRHILLINMHHIICDAWSIAVFGRLLGGVYTAYNAGATVSMEPLPLQYADFSVWQRQWLQGAVIERQLSYWKTQLAGTPPLLALPTDHPRTTQRTHKGCRHNFFLSTALVEPLRQLGRQTGATLFMTLLAGFTILLARYSGQTDICVGTPVANRPLQALENLIGFFINTVVLRTRIDRALSFKDYLQIVRNTALSAYANQDLPFEHLVEALKPERSLSYTPVFQVMFVLQNSPEAAFTLPDIDVSPVDVEVQQVKFDLTLILTETKQGIRGAVEYSTDLFESATIEQFCSHYTQLLKGIAKNPQQNVYQLPLLTKAQWQQMVVSWNNTDVYYPRDHCIDQLFDRQVKKIPDAVAVCVEGAQLTYQTLSERSNQLAHYLIELGVGPEVRVGLCVQPSLEMIVGLLAILKAGGAYVPIDPAYPQQRIDYFIKDSGITILLTEVSLLKKNAKRQGITYFCLDHNWPNIVDRPIANPRLKTLPLNLAYVVYTSGSTGKPKGVAVSHDNLGRLCYWYHQAFAVTAQSTITQLAGIGFDALAFEVWPCLTAGAHLYLVPPDFVLMPDLLAKWLISHRVTHCFAPTALVENLLNEPWPPFMALQFLHAGGDKLNQYPAADIPFALTNNYGTTETTVCATSGLVTCDGQLTPAIGKPISNTRLYILDAHFHPVPARVVGELYIGGDGVGRGYFNRPELTAQRFVPDPFSGKPGARLYQTGDLARYKADGNIEYRGRTDDQIKIRGFRIEPSEMEQALAAQKNIREVVVLAYLCKQGINDYYLVAYIVWEKKTIKNRNQTALRTALQKQLPDYMIPRFFIFLEHLPLTPNGKIDRRALPLPDGDSLLATDYRPPRTEVERALVAIWADILLLPLDKVGVDHNFFALGGHSLLATRVVGQIASTFNIDIPVRVIFTANTVYTLAPFVEKALVHGSLSRKAVYPIAPVARDNPLLLSFAQQRLWFLNQFEGGKEAQYTISWGLRFDGVLDVVALERAINTLIARHESLRTMFRAVDGEAVQVIADRVIIILPITEITEADISTQLAAGARCGFDLSAGPLLNIVLLRLSPKISPKRTSKTSPKTHILLINLHHIISDGWSIGVFNQELALLYTAYRCGKASPLLPLPIQYVDFAHWQRQWLQGEPLPQQMDYWKGQLSGALALLALPTDRPRPARQSYRGKGITFTLPRELTQQLHDIGRRKGVTLFMTLLTGFTILLARYSGQDDICVGTPIANRQRPELEKLIGFFANTLVLRTQLDCDTRVNTLLRQVKETALSAYAHQDIPFEQLVEVLKPERSLSYPPLFQVMFILQYGGQNKIELPDITVSPLDSEVQSAKFDITLYLTESGDGIDGVLVYNTDLFDRSTVERMAAHYSLLLEGIINNPSQRLIDLSILSEAERQQILFDWNGTEVAYPKDQCVHQLFEAQAQKTPHAIAVVFGDQRLTYKALNNKSNQLAHYLIEQGVEPEVRVGLCVERSLEMIIGLLGILKAGGVYVPVDPKYPQRRIQYLCNNSGIVLLLTQAKFADIASDQYTLVGHADNSVTIFKAIFSLARRFFAVIVGLCQKKATPPGGKWRRRVLLNYPHAPLGRICLDRDWSTLALPARKNPKIAINSANLAYIIYTSGSTGQPRGVMCTHQGLVNRLDWMQSRCPLTADDSVLQKTAFSFDVSVWELLWPLVAGAPLNFVGPEGHKDPVYLAEHISQHAITTLHFVPSMLDAFLACVSNSDFFYLKRVICSGEVLSLSLQDKFFACFKNTELYNLYGPTETSIDVSFWACCPISKGYCVPIGVPIGKPIANTQLFILDNNLEPVPVGVTGELYIGGDGLSRGYLRRPELTAERFIPLPFTRPFTGPFAGPFAASPGARLYKTGDLVRFRVDGNINYIGRTDHQLKIRGFRIELGEIEQSLMRQQGIGEAVVLAHSRQQAINDLYLVAYIVCDKKSTECISQTTIRVVLQAQLPDYMIPGFFIFLDKLPLTPNGKVNRKALPVPDEDNLLTQQYIAPRTDMENTLVSLWANLLTLSRDKVGIEDNFFALGGHSLLATRVASQIASTFTIDIQVQDIFTANTVQTLASFVEKAVIHSSLSHKAVYPITPIARDNTLPLSFAQQGLWFLNQFERGEGTRYNMPWALYLEGDLELAVLEKAFNALIERHESLRTTFKTVDNGAIQVVADSLMITLPVVEISKADIPTQLTAGENYLFDLSKGPLLNIGLLRLSSREYILLINLHHIIFDGWSMDVFNNELTVLYGAYRQGKASPLLPLAIQYADFAHWQRQWLQGGPLSQQIVQQRAQQRAQPISQQIAQQVEKQIAQQMDYWKGQLSGAPALLALPTDRPRPARQSYRGKGISFTLPRELTGQLHDIGRREGVTLFMTLLTGFTILLARYSGQDDICVGTPIANRQRPELEKLIGFFANTLVLRTQLDRDTRVNTLLQQVKETALSAYAHQDTPFEQLVEILKPERSLSYPPLFQVMFILQYGGQSKIELPDITVSPLDSEVQSAKFDITLHLTESGDGIDGVLVYNTDLFDRSTVERMTAHYRLLLEGIVNNPGQRLTDLAILSEVERQQILLDWNGTEVAYPKDQCVHQLFEAQAQKTPHAIALVFENQQVTYRALNNKSHQLAHYLVNQGVAAEVRVGLCVERSLNMIIGLLGILKAGGIYVPMDPDLPLKRLRHMVQDSNAERVLTQSSLLGKLADLLSDQVPLMALDRDWQAIAAVGESRFLKTSVRNNVQPSVQTSELAYIIYTSGSTGKSKGVMIPHQALTNVLVSMGRTLALVKDDILLAVTTFCFDIAGLEIYLPLINGAKLCLCHSETSRDPHKLAQVINHYQSTLMQATPVTWTMLLQVGWENKTDIKILCGGEVLSEKLKQQLLARSSEVWNLFGPTETTIWSTVCQLRREEPVHIGKPIANTQVYIIDSQQNAVPIGVVGELCIAGDGLARGYLQQPELTAEKFTANPFLAHTTLYRTGDLARWRADGNIDYIGRRDYQVKVRGRRIELGEIEQILIAQDSIRDAIVLVHSDQQEAGHHDLLAYLVCGDHIQGDRDETRLRAALQTQLPAYMIPRFFIFLAQLPLTRNGKIDRSALPLPDGDNPPTNGYRPPRTDMERALVAIWVDILTLALDKIGIDHDFFALGGHSLLATRVVGQIRNTFNIDIPVRDIFTASTVRTLAPIVERALVDSPLADKAVYPITPVARNNALPLSFAQQRLWFLNQFMGGEETPYTMPWGLRLVGAVDAAALERAVNTLVVRHESLRTTFPVVGEAARQAIADGLTLTVPVIEIAEADIATWLAANAKAVFDLSRGPLLQVVLLCLSPDEECLSQGEQCLSQGEQCLSQGEQCLSPDEQCLSPVEQCLSPVEQCLSPVEQCLSPGEQCLSEGEHLLLVNTHHIIFDGWSMGVFNQELAVLYSAYCRGSDSPLSPLPIQYADFAHWQRQWLQGDILAQQVAYWKTQLRGAPALLALPTDRPRPAIQRYRGKRVEFVLAAALTQRLRQLSRREGVTLFMLLLTGFVVLLARYSGQHDICVGTPIANRQRPELEKLLGFFANTLVLRTQLSKDTQVKALLQQVKETALSAYAHQDIPFEQLVEALKPERSLSYSPLFQVMFALQNNVVESLDLPGIRASVVGGESDTSKFDLTLSLAEVSDGLEGMVEYNMDLFDPPTIEHLIRHYPLVLEGMVSLPDQSLWALPLFSEVERQQKCGKFDPSALPLPDGDNPPTNGYRPPRTDMERALVAIWADILTLPLDKVGIDHNFFALGGHSLLATRVVGQIRNTFNIDIPVRDIFTASTVRTLASIVERALVHSSLVDSPLADKAVYPITPVARDNPLPLSFAQQRLWFLNQFMEGEETPYTMPWGLRLVGAVDAVALERAVNTLVVRHESLRTTFPVVDEAARQAIADGLALTVPVIEIAEADIATWLAANAKAIFDLSRGPLLQVMLLCLSPVEQCPSPDEECLSPSEQCLSPGEHLLLVNTHHIIFDGWSMGVFNQELAVLYSAYCRGSDSPLSPLPVQYADFAHWQRQWLQGDVLAQQVAYWKTQLSGAPALLALPTDRPRPAIQRYRGKRVEFVLAAALTQRLRQLSRREGVTLFMLLLTGFVVLLARYSGQHDICVGTPIANRQRPELEKLLGFFANTLVLRTQLGKNTRVKALLQQVKEMALSAYAHQDIPFEQLVEALKPERSLSYSPLFQVMFALQNIAEESIVLPEIKVSTVESETCTAKFDLMFTVVETNQALEAAVEYNTDLFDQPTIERMLTHYQRLLTTLVDQPGRRVVELSLLSEEEREKVLFGWNKTAAHYPKDRCIHHLFEQQVEKTPSAIALVFKYKSLSYAALNKKSNQLAHYLIEQGVGPEVKVGLYAERSLEVMIGLLGILKAGGAYVPIDPETPQQRIDYILEDAQAEFLLTQTTRANKIVLLPRGKILCVDGEGFAALMDQYSDNNLAPQDLGLAAHNLAYTIYTSGSTGKPKGVLLNHQGLVNLSAAHSQLCVIDKQSCVLQFASIGFDAATWEWVWALTHGARLTMIAANTAKSSDMLTTCINDYRITHAVLPPALLPHLGSSQFPQLSCLVAAGEACSQELAQLWCQGRYFFNAYGPTEATVCSAIYRYTQDSPAISIGRPLANFQLYVLDDYLSPVPIGVVGELYIGGLALARGYYCQPALTAKKFIPHPFCKNPGERLYKTDDIVRYRLDGNIDYIGRRDFQVKVRGFRIELGEIEKVAMAQAGVREAIALADNPQHNTKHNTGGPYLIAYLVCEQSADGGVDQAALKTALQAQLPDYMIPRIFIFLDRLPLTPNGKVDRKALPLPEPSALSMQKYAAPRTEIERALVNIWADALNLPVDTSGIDDNFFELGGNSLLAIYIASQIRKIFNLAIQIRDLFAANTIRTLASLVEKAMLDSPLSDRDAYPLVPHKQGLTPPLSFAQQRLWFINQFEGGRETQYTIPWGLRLVGSLDIVALENAFNALVERHHSLRTTFQTVAGQTVQVIADRLILTLAVIETKAVNISAQLAANANTVFDLSQGPLLKFVLLRLSPEKHILLVNIHHVIFDSLSMWVFNKELKELYSAYSRGKKPSLLPLPIQYADFAHWQRHWMQGKVLKQQVDYWKGQLCEAPAFLTLPTDRPRPVIQSYRGQAIGFVIPNLLAQQLYQLTRQEGVTLFMILLAGFNALLARYSGQNDLCVGTPIANRQRPEVEPLIGLFVNTLVLRTQVDRDITCRDLLKQVKETALSAYAHQDIPFEYLVEVLQPQRSLSYQPLFQVMFILQNRTKNQIELPNIVTSAIDSEVSTAKFDLTLGLMESNKGLEGWVEYNTDLFDQCTIERMIGHYQRLLQGMVDNPDQRVLDISVLDTVERQQILFDWNKTQTPYPDDQCIHQLFEAQAAQTPDTVAVIFENQYLTYAQLNKSSNQLAHHLVKQRVKQGVKQGVKQTVEPSTRVGLCVEHSFETMISILGILKAGGTCVLLDPAYPQKRLAYMLAQADISILLTQKKLCEQLPVRANTIALDDRAIWHSAPDAIYPNLATGVKAQHLAYVIFTSGSTDCPKAIAMPHSALANLIYWQVEQSDCRLGDKTLQFSALSFDVSFQELFSTWCSGGSVVVITEDKRKDPFTLWHIIREQGIHRLFMPFIALQQLAEVYQDAVALQARPNGLKEIITAGEQLQITPAIRSLFHQLVGCQLYNHYGPSETHVCTSLVLTGSPQSWALLPTIGKPIANKTAYILDAALQPVPIGVYGELTIGCSGLARGYLNQAVLTAKCFIPDPFAPNSGGRLYKTGDLARFRADGSIEYRGRVDSQIKIRGYRIEPDEIESILSAQPGVNAAAIGVCYRDQQLRDKYLAAYIVAEGSVAEERFVEDSGQSQLKERLHQAVQAALPGYMVPSVFIFLASLPLTPSGKVDRRALPSPDKSALSTQGYMAPRTGVEKTLVAIWADTLALPVEKVSIKDNFFELGGHSLLVAKLISQLRKICGEEVPLRVLFEYPSVISLAMFLESDGIVPSDDVLIDLAEEAVLDPAIDGAYAQYPCVDNPRAILLTGATGFLGRFLLCELLQQTTAQLYCLVRGDNETQAFERLKTCLVSNQLWQPEYAARVSVVVGDLAQPRFGLSEAEFTYLAEHMDVIYHNATAMNHIAPYPVLKAATVSGTQEVLRLACMSRLKPVHFSSTTGIFSQSPGQFERVVDEYSCIDNEQHLVSQGYLASKWVAEKLVMLAQARGIPCCIYRFGLLAGDRQQGRYDADQWLYRLIASCVQLGCYPVDFGELGLLPVDLAVKSLVYLAQQQLQYQLRHQLQHQLQHGCHSKAALGVFHLDNQYLVDVRRFFEAYNRIYRDAAPLRALPFKQWLQAAKAFAESGEKGKGRSLSICPLILHLASGSNDTLTPNNITQVESDITRTRLEKGGLYFPVIDQSLLEIYMRFILQSVAGTQQLE